MLHPSHLHPIITCWEKYAGSWDLFSVNIKKLAFYKSVCCFILRLLHLYKNNQAQEHTRNQHSVCTWSPLQLCQLGPKTPSPKSASWYCAFHSKQELPLHTLAKNRKGKYYLFKEHSKKFSFRIFFYMRKYSTVSYIQNITS